MEIFEAKARLLAFLRQVEAGEQMVITRHGRAVAQLVPAGAMSSDQLADTVARLKTFRRGRRLGGLSAKALVEEGRYRPRRQGLSVQSGGWSA